MVGGSTGGWGTGVGGLDRVQVVAKVAVVEELHRVAGLLGLVTRNQADKV
ncbi:hypothetical protein [Brevibacillus formosus]|nr:hypothetical protein [Brevibacillus formosus]